ncbi:hypothetical protein [Zooshikella ganghwensis]|uniref:Uncharacterized protein n=1 Tax=Zooshikella ganghwensis TaxID=202772 RepID=A0A4V1INC6_9GAMM|nr:hypothetical protein [Zooshikella ganghwensis]RDH43261.1 hypothetical protein B9G39_07300 [Zooshikella ganghwensis]
MKTPIKLADYPDNPDLFWDLSSIINKNKAAEFFKRVARAFCVYSPTVKKIYSNFEVLLAGSGREGIIVLPDPYAFHDTFSHINEAAIKKTGVILYPGAAINQKGLFIGIPLGHEQRMRHLSFTTAINFLNRIYQKKIGIEFLPVLVNGDLREFAAKTPYLHLHRLDTRGLSNQSSFEKNDIGGAIKDKFSKITPLITRPSQ